MRKNCKLLYLIICLCILSFNFLLPDVYASDYTISGVISVQEQASGAYETMSGEFESHTEYGGNTMAAGYVYSMKNLNDGSRQVMVKTTGIFTMQFLVDTADMSVTYLMADGSLKKVTITPDTKEEIMNMAGLGGIGGGGSVYAAVFGQAKRDRTDGVYDKALNTPDFENDRVRVKVRKKTRLFGAEAAEVEFYDKKAAGMRLALDERISKAEAGKAEKEGARKMKKRFIDGMKREKEKIIKTTVVKRKELINMKSGITEASEFYNLNDERIGHMKVRKMGKIKHRKNRVTTAENSPAETELPQEVEVEMEGPQGKSKSIMKYKNLKINEETDFEWIKPAGGKR